MSEQFKRGQRVRYVGRSATSLNGKTGTVEGPIVSGPNQGWIMVRFDHNRQSGRIAPCNLERLVSPEASEDLRERVMRLSYHLPSTDLDEAISIIFRADSDNDGCFTEAQYERLDSIARKAAVHARTKETVT